MAERKIPALVEHFLDLILPLSNITGVPEIRQIPTKEQENQPTCRVVERPNRTVVERPTRTEEEDPNLHPPCWNCERSGVSISFTRLREIRHNSEKVNVDNENDWQPICFECAH